jgi:hypothetical protein
MAYKNFYTLFADPLTALGCSSCAQADPCTLYCLWGNLWRPLSVLLRGKNDNYVTFINLIRRLFNYDVSTAEVSVELGQIIVTDSEKERACKQMAYGLSQNFLGKTE